MTIAHETAQDLPDHASIARVIKDQRKTEFVALALIVISLWFGPTAGWGIPACVAGGVALGLINHLVTEYWLLRVITSGGKPTRGQLTRSTAIRLAILSVIAIGVAALFWPVGIGFLLGLAIFRLIALVMTTLPLLKELKNS